MAKRSKEIVVDLASKNFQEIVLKQFDTTELIFSILNNNESYTLTGLTAEIWFVKPNDSVVQQNATIDNGKVKVTLNADCLRNHGRGKVEVSLKSNSESISSFQIDVKIERSGKGNAASSNTPSYYEVLENIVETENTRIQNETARVNAEASRASAEAARSTAESSRVSAETTRIQNEQARQAGYNSLEKIHNVTRATVSTEIQKETDYTLPVNYIVGSGDLVLFYNNEILIPGQDGNYIEVGEFETVSNKVQFGWNVAAGSIITIIVKGVVEDDE